MVLDSKRTCGGQGRNACPPAAMHAMPNLSCHQTASTQVLVLGAVQSEQLRSGDSDPSQEPLVYLLCTSTAKRQPQPAPYLPSGSIASGLAAALLSHCQVGSSWAVRFCQTNFMHGRDRSAAKGLCGCGLQYA